MMNDSTPESNQTCKMCGTCCRKGGPALHKIDQDLVVNGVIPLHDLFTIRPGELVLNQIKKTNEPTSDDIIKIKGSGENSWRCRYFNSAFNTCRIYANRPLECRVLKCWDTHAIESIYQHDRLCRKDLLGQVAGLMELIEFHQHHCDHTRLNKWTDNLSSKDPKIQKEARKAILESIHWDLRIREASQKNANADAAHLDFIIGRPLHNILKILGWKIHQENNAAFGLHSIAP